ncbi:hypothetical protein AN946_06450 [Trueperella pyogenes]|nr:hypothetical protein AN946_06450 [Trueperella pyogenes]
MLGEYLLKRLSIHRAWIEQCFHYLVAKELLESAFLERLTAHVPVRLWLLRIREHLAPLVAHELVVYLPESSRP